MPKIEKLYLLGSNIFTVNDLRIIWQENNFNALKSSVKYFANKGKLHRIKKGIYSLQPDYDKFELAQKLIIPSYISLETALQKHGIIFQFSSAITSMAKYGRIMRINSQEYHYHAIKEEILFNPLGINRESNYTIASAERAICDFIYLNGPSHFDNLRVINPDYIIEISKIYSKKTLMRTINDLIKKL